MRQGDGKYTNTDVNLYDLGQFLIGAGTSVSQVTIDNFFSKEIIDNLNLITDNNLIIMKSFAKEVWIERYSKKNTPENTPTEIKYSESVENQASIFFWSDVALLCILILLLVLMAAFAFRPAFSRIHTERNKTLELFLKIPKDVIYRLSQGKKGGNSSDDDIDVNSRRSSIDLGPSNNTSDDIIEIENFSQISLKRNQSDGVIMVTPMKENPKETVSYFLFNYLLFYKIFLILFNYFIFILYFYVLFYFYILFLFFLFYCNFLYLIFHFFIFYYLLLFFFNLSFS